MWVRPAFRGRGVGQLLIENALDAARALGLKTVHLDTVPSMMQAAVDLYLRNGFIECERYNANSAPGARFFCREL
jgi:GNAT superfamily N-acetyltransferase